MLCYVATYMFFYSVKSYTESTFAKVVNPEDELDVATVAADTLEKQKTTLGEFRYYRI